MDRSFALKLLQRFDYNVGDAINEYFTNQEAYKSPSSSLLDLEAEEKHCSPISPMHKNIPIPTDSAAKDRIYERLRISFPDVPAEDLHDAVHQGNVDDESSTTSYLNSLAERRYHDNK